MSRTEHIRGTLVAVNAGGIDGNDMARLILKGIGITDMGGCDSWIETLTDEYYHQYYYHPSNDTIYEIRDRHEMSDEDVIRANRQPIGYIDYEVKFYNGGCGETECIEEALDALFKKEGNENPH